MSRAAFDDSTDRVSRLLCCGAIAGPLFVLLFTVIGATRPGYDWRRHTVSSLGAGRRGWLQRANFMLAGVLYCGAAKGLFRCTRQSVVHRVVPGLVAAAGFGLIGSGVFVTDPIGGFPPETPGSDGPDNEVLRGSVPTIEGRLHNLCAVPIFIGIPLASLISAIATVRSKNLRWAGMSVLSSVATLGSIAMMGRAFDGAPRLVNRGGIFQRISILSGFGWLVALSLRALRRVAAATPAGWL
jgi:hypothetical protein